MSECCWWKSFFNTHLFPLHDRWLNVVGVFDPCPVRDLSHQANRPRHWPWPASFLLSVSRVETFKVWGGSDEKATLMHAFHMISHSLPDNVDDWFSVKTSSSKSPIYLCTSSINSCAPTRTGLSILLKIEVSAVVSHHVALPFKSTWSSNIKLCSRRGRMLFLRPTPSQMPDLDEESG